MNDEKKMKDVDVERIYERLEKVQKVALIIMEKAWAIREQPNPKTAAGVETTTPPDASRRIMGSLDYTLEILDSARDSLQAFI